MLPVPTTHHAPIPVGGHTVGMGRTQHAHLVALRSARLLIRARIAGSFARANRRVCETTSINLISYGSPIRFQPRIGKLQIGTRSVNADGSRSVSALVSPLRCNWLTPAGYRIATLRGFYSIDPPKRGQPARMGFDGRDVSRRPAGERQSVSTDRVHRFGR